MAAFVGNHAVVALINNYVPMNDVIQYTQKSGLEKEAKLPSAAAKPVYNLIMQVWRDSNGFFIVLTVVILKHFVRGMQYSLPHSD